MLIYDVGVCNGDDSAYYLHKGYKVVGVEANPLLIPRLRRRFRSEIQDGRYELLSLGIAEADGEAQFWVCDDKPEWSSFDRSIASRNGSRHHGVIVETRRFRSLLEAFGTPVYCKIDIEGNDDLCLQDLTPATKPQFLSVEVIEGDRQIRRLSELGYARFKLISQRTLRQPGSVLTALKFYLPNWARRVAIAGAARVMRHRPERLWRHPPGSSGPFGDLTHGDWRSADEVFEDWRRTHAFGNDPNEWYDVHAAA